MRRVGKRRRGGNRRCQSHIYVLSTTNGRPCRRGLPLDPASMKLTTCGAVAHISDFIAWNPGDKFMGTVWKPSRHGVVRRGSSDKLDPSISFGFCQRGIFKDSKRVVFQAKYARSSFYNRTFICLHEIGAMALAYLSPYLGKGQ